MIENMWNTINNNMVLMGHNKHMMGPNTTQKRHYGYDCSGVGTKTVDKTFINPNFVNKDCPKVRIYHSPCHIDIANQTFSNDAPYINSSLNIFEAIKEKKFDIVQPFNTDQVQHTVDESSKGAMPQKRTRKSRMMQQKGNLLKNRETSVKYMKKEISEMMEVDSEPLVPIMLPEINMSPKEHHLLTLGNFLTNKNSIATDENYLSNKNSVETDESDANQIDEDDVDLDSFTMISNSVCIDSKAKRDRTLSTAESEDSFIVFESGTDDELEFSDDTEDEGESEEDEEDLNSSPFVVPRKKTAEENNMDIFRPINTDYIQHTVNKSSEDKAALGNKRTRKSIIMQQKGDSFEDREKSAKHRKKEISEMIEINVEPQVYSKEHHFLTFNVCPSNENPVETDESEESDDSDESDTNQMDEEDVDMGSFAIISNSMSIDCVLKRERTISTTESEDSFIVFEGGTLDELDTEDECESNDEDESEDESDDEELNSSPSIVSSKKVRFADDSELCQIHPMIMWSYAYQSARIGPWQRYALDRTRFADRIRGLEAKLKPVLDSQHRERIFMERFQNLDLSTC